MTYLSDNQDVLAIARQATNPTKCKMKSTTLVSILARGAGIVKAAPTPFHAARDAVSVDTTSRVLGTVTG